MHDCDPSQLIGFLAQRLGLSEEELPKPSEWAGSGNTIGSLALRMAMLDLDHIESIVDGQVSGESRFGDTAVELGTLSRAQVDLLVRMQDFHRCIDVAGPLVMSGRLKLSELVALLAEFLADD